MKCSQEIVPWNKEYHPMQNYVNVSLNKFSYIA